MKLPEKNVVEWVVFWSSLASVLAVCGYLAYAAASAGNRPPLLTATVGEPQEVPAGFAVPITVSNTGDTTAESVMIEVLIQGDPAERGELAIAFVPHGSSRRGWVTFTRRPDVRALRVRVKGYEEP